MYLLDTNVISEMHKPRPHGAVLAWFRVQAEENLHLSAVNVLELQRGAERTRKQDRPRAEKIDHWIDQIINTLPIIALDTRIAREGARLMVGRSEDLFEDAMLAATARIHRLTVATRNLKDFALFDVPTFNPFTYSN
ncbi:MAG: type II toxin-antitoxin system VapC family toxin [Acidobacteriaceae bacterium]